MAGTTTLRVEACLARLRAGEAPARAELLATASDRLLLLTRQMLRRYQTVRRWEETDDVCQNALVRLNRALEAVQPASPLDFFRLASTQIRRELIDLARRYSGPHGLGTQIAGDLNSNGQVAAADDEDPRRLAQWSEFHEQVSKLPDEERTLFDLLWYQGLAQSEAAEVVGVSLRTVKSRWRSARLLLHERLGGDLPMA